MREIQDPSNQGKGHERALTRLALLTDHFRAELEAARDEGFVLMLDGAAMVELLAAVVRDDEEHVPDAARLKARAERVKNGQSFRLSWAGFTREAAGAPKRP